MDYSILVARFLGIFFVVYGIAVLINGKKFKTAIVAAKNCAGLSWLIGITQVLWGTVLILVQETWTGWMILPSIASWLIFLMGIGRLWCCRCSSKECPTDKTCDTTTNGKCSTPCLMIIGIILVVWGAAMIYCGFFGGDMNNVMSMMHQQPQAQ